MNETIKVLEELLAQIEQAQLEANERYGRDINDPVSQYGWEKSQLIIRKAIYQITKSPQV